MGSTSWSDDLYSMKSSLRARSATKGFDYDHDVKIGKVDAKVHTAVDPKKLNTFNKLVRESLDSDAHPNSVPIAVIFDNTGSMADTPKIFIQKLGKLMNMLVKKGILADPQILFGAYNDAKTHCVAPLQIGQFESGIEMDDSLEKILLEGGGGGHITESGELAFYFLARKTELDSVKKRGKKGYYFQIGDELPYSSVKAQEVKNIIGDNLEADIPTEEILNELREKFEVFWIMPGGTNHQNDANVVEPLKKMFGQNYLVLPDANDVCELIATTIGITEGYEIDTIKNVLRDVGADDGAIDRTSGAVVKYANSRALSRTGKIDDLVPVGTDTVERL